MSSSLLTAETRTARRKGASRDWRFAWIFLAPFLLLFLLFRIVPVVFAIGQSLFTQTSSGTGFGAATVDFAGLANYARALTDPTLLTAAGRVLLYGLVQVPVMLVLALAMALLFDSGMVRLRRALQLFSFLPYAVPGVIGSIIWAFLYVPGISPIVNALQALDLPADFLSPHTVLWSIANVTTWQWTGYNMIIIFSALQALPRDIFEAAKLDGATGWHVARLIKVPLVMPAIVLTALFSIIGTLQLFSEPMVLKTLTGNVTYNYTPNMFVYNLAFGTNDAYYASAVSVVMAVATFLLSLGLLKLLQRRSDDD
ncbi:carbohydrate ABC transporter permease [Leifsonia sp. McL0607]|uniref:carbohydrate ABC transporter permease n=1 Tax=Leifsonia sp. McL0607 TaxID=3415672 RepID=UPI003CFA8538